MKNQFAPCFAAVLPFLIPSLALSQDGPESVIRGTKQFRKSAIVSGLDGPWEVTWGPDRMLWVTERTGKRVTRVDPTTGERKVAVTIDEVVAPGGQDGLLGMALHPRLLQGTANNYVYVAYTYVDRTKQPDARVADPASPYRNLYGKIVRLRYRPESGTLSDPMDLITGLPAGNDHNGMRLKIGPDSKLYLSIGDQGNNQLGNFCHPVLAQRLPTAREIAAKDYSAYEGKTLRLNLDGSVPKDNPKLDGVVSHVNTYGHRNPQGLDFGPDGTLYSTEHGPKTDDEVNVLKSGGNYGWPNVAGMRDDKAYRFARWAEAATPCSDLRFSDLAIHPSVPNEPETAFAKPLVEPIATMFTVPTGFNFEDPACQGVNYICWPTVGVSSVEYYGARKGAGIPGWDAVLLITTLKRGSLYVMPLDATRRKSGGRMSRYFQSENRFRDTAVHPDGRTIYVATDPGGLAESRTGGVTTDMEDKGAILAFTYTGEGGPGAGDEPRRVSESVSRPSGAVAAAAGSGQGTPPGFTAQQVTEGKKGYETYCAVCHGSTLTNGTFGTPLAGGYFKTKWFGKTVADFYEKSRSTMPPAAPASLPKSSYASIVAYILDVNGFKAGSEALPSEGAELQQMRIQ